MSAGRIRFLEPGAKGPKTPAFRLRLKDGGELILTEGGPKKRARVGVYRPDQLEAELALPRPGGGRGDHGPGSWRRSPAARRGACIRSSATSGAFADRACVAERDPNPRCSSPRTRSRPSSRTRRSSARGDHPRADGRGPGASPAGAADKKAYKVHNRSGELCPNCATPIACVDFEEHTIFYCPECR